MKRWFRCISFLLALSLLLAVPAFAAETVTPRANDYIMRTCVYLDQISGTQFDVWYEVIALGEMEELGAYKIRIQKSSDGESWTTVYTFTQEDEPSMVLENSWAHFGYVTYTGVSGYYYRAKITMFAENSTGRGEVITYTETLRL